MGCGSSKMSSVAPAPKAMPQPAKQLPVENASTETHVQHEEIERQTSGFSIGSKKSIKIRKNSVVPKTVDKSGIIKVQEAEIQRNSSSSESDSSQYSSRESINTSTRLVSAYSTESKGSQDSGLGEDYANIITEKSESTNKEVANLPEGMDKPSLLVEGERVKVISSGGHRKLPHRLPPIQTPVSRVMISKDLINELPDSPSIIKKPCARGGLAFDIVLNDVPTDVTERRKPAHLVKLEKKPRKGLTVSFAELDEKQKAAEQRRKEQSQMLLERLRAKQEKDRQVAEALARFAAMQTEIKNGVTKKIETTTEKREAYLKAMRDRLKEKSQKVDEVKKAKKAQESGSSPPKEVPVNN